MFTNSNEVVITSQPPFLILALDVNVQSMLGYTATDLIGKSISKLFGNRIDHLHFLWSIQQLGCSESIGSQYTLFRSDGKEQKVLLSYAPYLEEREQVLGRLCITPSETVTLQEALAIGGGPHALSSAESPHKINVVTDLFAAKFKCTIKKALGQPLASFISEWRLDFDLDLVLKNVVNGQRISGMLGSTTSSENFRPKSEEITFTPVVETTNGRVLHILVHISQIESSDSEVPPHFRTNRKTHSRQQDPPLSSPSIADLNPSPLPLAPSITSLRSSPASSHRSRSPTPRGSHAPARSIILRPRSSHRTPASRAAEVTVTPELLGALRALPLPQAAAAAGISATAFKRACRRLGVRRWGYTRGPAKRGACEGATAASSAEPQALDVPPSAACPPRPAPAARPAAGSTAGSLWPVPVVLAVDDCAGLGIPAGGFGDGGGYGAASTTAGGAWEWAADGEVPLWWEEEEDGEEAADDVLVLDMLAQPWPEWGAAAPPPGQEPSGKPLLPAT
jgi:hypothetical protein